MTSLVQLRFFLQHLLRPHFLRLDHCLAKHRSIGCTILRSIIIVNPSSNNMNLRIAASIVLAVCNFATTSSASSNSFAEDVAASHPRARALEEMSSDCHCDGTGVHCSNEIEEEFCSCVSNGTLACVDPFDGCHCDGSVVHCNDGAVESACHCDDGSVHCE